MPPFREGPIYVDRRLDEDLLYELRRIGHGHRINIVDASYSIPDDAKVLKFPGSSADAFAAIVQCIPVEGENGDALAVIEMAPDSNMLDEVEKVEVAGGKHVATLAMKALSETIRKLNALKVGGSQVDWYAEHVNRFDNSDGPGFYSIAKNPNEQHLFVRTTDDLPYACITLVVGHSQRTQ